MLVAVAELSINRLVVPALLPTGKGEYPLWYRILKDDVGLFLIYFGAALAIGYLAVRAVGLLRGRRATGVVLAVALAPAAVTAAVATVVSASNGLSVLLAVTWGAALLALVVVALVERRELGVAIAIAVLASPLFFHLAVVVDGYRKLADDRLGEGWLADHAHSGGLLALTLAALATPYCLTPRPVIRSIGRIAPIVVALAIGALAAVLVRLEHAAALDLGSYAVGVDLRLGVSNNDLALYLLAISTLTWTLTSCTLAPAEARREVGLGLGLVVLGGYGFVWPFHFLLSLVGLFVMYDASARLRGEETGHATQPRTPVIKDDPWLAWIQQLAAALRADDGDEVKSLTTRGEDDTAQTVLVGERAGVPFKARFIRVGGALVAIEVVAGREVPETQRATFTVYAKPVGALEPHPAPPPAAPAVQLDDEPFMQRFRVRGDAAAVGAVLDDGLRARAAAMIDGWLAWWEGASMRFRVYPAVGAPLDHPVPIADLAMRGTGAVDRMVKVIDLVTEATARGLASTPAPAEPAVLE